MKIAIIEDDKITRLELSKLLNSHGYETVLLTDFENLSEESKKYSFDLILLDINLPYENGYEICRKMKKLMSVPIIFVTSRDTSADELLSIQAGGIDFITKPYDTLILLEKIKRALQLSNPNNFRELTKKVADEQYWKHWILRRYPSYARVSGSNFRDVMIPIRSAQIVM